MHWKKWLNAIVIAAVGLTGLYLIITSGRIQVEPYSLVLFLIVAGFMVYLYLIYVRRQE